MIFRRPIFLLLLGALAASAHPRAEQSAAGPTVDDAVSRFHLQHPEASPIGKQVTPPKLLKSVPLAIPENARSKVRTGSSIIIEAVINKKGDVSSAAIVRSEHDDLNEAALLAVRSRKYQPAMKNGAAVSVFMTVVMTIDVR